MSASTFEVVFNTDNAAFTDDPGAEIARILREVADHYEDHVSGDVFRIWDINGNRVGFAHYADGKEFRA